MAISITRLSGGNTPADGSDPRTFPAIWNATATTLEANVGEGGGSITVSPTAPTDPVPASGDLWWNSTEGELYVYYNDGSSSQWVAAAGPSVTVASVAPTGYEGQLWLDSTDGSMYVYYTDPGGGSSSWIGAVSRSGGILQVVSTTKTDTFTSSSTSFVDITGLSATITPRSTSSKILVMASVASGNTSSEQYGFRFMRDATPIAVADAAGSRTLTTIGAYFGSAVSDYHLSTLTSQVLDTPGTTASVTYKVQGATNAATFTINRNGADLDVSTVRRAVSTITLMEVAG